MHHIKVSSKNPYASQYESTSDTEVNPDNNRKTGQSEALANPSNASSSILRKNSSGTSEYLVRKMLLKNQEEHQDILPSPGLEPQDFAEEIKALHERAEHKKLLAELAAIADMTDEDFSKLVEKPVLQISEQLPSILQDLSKTFENITEEPSDNVISILNNQLGKHTEIADKKQPAAASDISLTQAQQNMADSLLQHYMVNLAGLKGDDPELKAIVARATLAFNSIGCENFEDAKRVLEKMTRQDAWVRTIGNGMAGGAGYLAGLLIFMRKVAPHLGEDITPAQTGMTAGVIVAMVDAFLAAAIGKITSNHLYGKKTAGGGKQLQDAQTGFAKTICVIAGMNAGYSILKNLSRILAPLAFPSQNREQAENVDFWLDAGGGFLSSAAANLHANRVLQGKFMVPALLADPDFAQNLKRFTDRTSIQTAGKSLAADALTSLQAGAKALRSPSSYLVSLYIGALVAALLHAKSEIGKRHRDDEGYSPDLVGRWEGAEKGAIATGMMGALVGGATAIGIGANVLIDPYMDALCDRLSRCMSRRAFMEEKGHR